MKTVKFIGISARILAKLILSSRGWVIKLKVKYVGERRAYIPNSYEISMDVIPNKIYEVLSIENGFYRIIDESDEDYLYPPEKFVIVSDALADSLAR